MVLVATSEFLSKTRCTNCVKVPVPVHSQNQYQYLWHYQYMFKISISLLNENQPHVSIILEPNVTLAHVA